MSEIVNSSLRTAAKGTTLVLFGTAVSNLLWFATKLLIARNSTAGQLGTYSLMVAIVSVASVVATLGVHEGASKYVSIFMGEGRRKDAEAVCTASMQIGAFSSLLAFAVLFFMSGAISRYVFYKPEIESSLKIISFFVPFNVLSLISIWILRGYGFIRPRVYFMETGTPFFFFVLLGLFFFFRLPFESVFYAFAMAAFAVFISVSIYGYRKTGFPLLLLKGGSGYVQLLRFSFSILLLVLMTVVFGWTDTLMLGRYSSSEDVGIYNIGMLLATVLTLPHQAAGFVFMPIAGEMFARGQTTELKKTYQTLTKWIFSVSFPLFFILFFFPEMTITVLFGSRFAAAALPLRILSLGFLLQTFMGASAVLMIITGLSREIRNVSIAGTVLNILLNYLFIKRLGYGILGASAATMLSYIIVGSANLILLYRRSCIHPVTLRLVRPILASLLLSVFIYEVSKSLPLYLWLLPLYLVIFVVGYFFSLVVMGGFDKEDLAMLDAVSQKTGLSMAWLLRIVGRHNAALGGNAFGKGQGQ